MKFFRATTRFSALLLLVLTVYIVAHSLILPKHELSSLQEQTICTASLEIDNGSDLDTDLGDCKPPKHSFIDYSNFFSPDRILPAYNPEISRLLVYEPFQALPAIYLEINVPPDNLA